MLTNEEKRKRNCICAMRYHYAHREAILKRMRQHRLNHLEEARAYDRERYKKRCKKLREAACLRRRTNPQKTRDTRLRSMYGLSLLDFQKLSKKQKDACAICYRKVKLCVDHCHQTGIVRGLLCTRCNRLLGMIQDSVKELRSAIRYLQRKRK